MLIKGNDLCMVAGNPDAIRVTFNRKPKTGDKVVFRVVNRVGDKKPLIEITSDSFDSNNSCVLYIDPDKTRDLGGRDYPYELTLISQNSGTEQSILWVENCKHEIRRIKILRNALGG